MNRVVPYHGLRCIAVRMSHQTIGCHAHWLE